MSGTITFALILPLAALHDPHETAADPSVCRCEKIKITDGWCAMHKTGYFAAQRVESASVFNVLDLHGHDVDPEKTRCPTCRDAMRRGGFCDACNMGYIRGHGYFSRVCYHFAHGRITSPGAGRNPCCPKIDGWCELCSAGFLANRRFDDRAAFHEARRYFILLKSALAVAARCESCCMAMIADSRCPACRVTYKDGVPVEVPATQPATQPAAAPRKPGD